MLWCGVVCCAVARHDVAQCDVCCAVLCCAVMSRVTCGMPRNDAWRIPGQQRGAILGDETSGCVCPGMRNPLDPARFAGWWGCSAGLRMSGHTRRDGCWSVVLSGGMIWSAVYVWGCATRWILPGPPVDGGVLPGCVCRDMHD